MGAGRLGQGLQSPSPPTGPWTRWCSSGWVVGMARSRWVLPSQGRMAQPGGPSGSRGLWVAIDARVPVPLHVAAGVELRVMLHSASGRRTVWSVVGHRSRGWRGSVVPVQSLSEFQVSRAPLGCRVPSPCITP